MLQDWFIEAKLGIFIHWGIYAVKPTGESWPFFNGEISYEDYMSQMDGFGAEKYDPAAWAKLIQEAGAQYAILTTKHHDGVALWDTKLSDLNVIEKCPAGRDLIEPYCAALREHDIKVGLYFSHLDWSHPDYPSLPKEIPEEDTGGASKTNRFNYQGKTDYEAWSRFLAFHRGQLKELCTQFDPDLLWFDGDWDRSSEEWKMKELRDELHAWAPGVVLNSRMKAYGDYSTPEQGLPVLSPDGEWEYCMTMNDHWGYMDSDTNYKSLSQIIRIFVECISMGGKLLLDIGPRADGTIPEEQEERLRGLGSWIRKHKEAAIESIKGISRNHYAGPSTLSRDRKNLYLFLFDLPQNQIFLNGLRNPIKRITILGTKEELEYKRMGGADWLNIPGNLWIDFPSQFEIGMGSVVKIELESELDLFTGKGGAVAQN